jgi:hypothetical protein
MGLDWKDARIGLNIIDNILYDNVFVEGDFNYYGFYKFGTYLGTIREYFHILKDNEKLYEDEHFLGKLKWVEIEFINAYRELALFKGDKDFPPYVGVFKENIDLSIEKLNLIIDYMLEKFIDLLPLQKSFSLGLRIGNYFIDDKQLMHEDKIREIEKDIIEHSRDFIENFINGEFEISKEEFPKDLASNIEIYKKELENYKKFPFDFNEENYLIELFEEHTVKTISMLNPGLVNTSSNFTFADIDTPRLKELYIEEYRKSKDIVVVLYQNGNLNIAKDKMANMFSINPEEELLFKNESHFSIVSKIKWEELKDQELNSHSINLAEFYNDIY